MGAYVSCNCNHCRRVPSKIRSEHKKTGHRMLRRISRKMIQAGTPDNIPRRVSTGYR